MESHWKLARRPFANTPDPTFVYRAPSFTEGLARLLYDATELRGGLALVTGENGCGKTMLAGALAEMLAGGPCDVIALPYPRIAPTQLLALLSRGLGMESVPRGKLPLVEALGARLGELHRNGRRPVLVVDEAQLAAPSLLEEIRLLTNHEDRQDKHLHVVLLGQPELRERVRKRSTFSDDAPALLAERSGGVPRRMNTRAAQALFVGAMRKLESIDAALVGDVADDQA